VAVVIGIAPVPETAAPAEERVRELRRTFASEAAFRDFFDRSLPRVYGYLFHRCQGDHAVAEDLAQATMVEAVRHHDRYDGRADPVTWLIAIARHKLVDHYRELERQERRRMRLVVRELQVDPDDAAWRDVDEREALYAAMRRLTTAQQAVLVLHYADGLPVREVARQIGRSEGATESLLTRAREALRAAYGEAGDD
jgi:RNA polymerase sigma-70 factor (ECF subfamily)